MEIIGGNSGGTSKTTSRIPQSQYDLVHSGRKAARRMKVYKAVNEAGLFGRESSVIIGKAKSVMLLDVFSCYER